MMKLIILAIVIAVKILLTKGGALAIFLFMLWIKGKSLKTGSEKWDNFFLQITPQAVQRYVIAIYLTAAFISSAISYFILKALSYRYSFEIAFMLFAGGFAVTAYRWQREIKNYVFQRYKEIPEMILKRQKNLKD